MHRKDESSALSTAQGEMRSGERLIWADRPAPARLAISRLPLALLGATLSGFALYWIVKTAIFTIAEMVVISPLPILGLPVLVVGLWMVLAPARMWADAKKTLYAISSDRVMIIKGNRVQSFAPYEIEDVKRRERSDGSGDVIFKRQFHRDGNRFRVSGNGLFGVLEVRRVEDEIRKLKERAGD